MRQWSKAKYPTGSLFALLQQGTVMAMTGSQGLILVYLPKVKITLVSIISKAQNGLFSSPVQLMLAWLTSPSAPGHQTVPLF